MASYTTRSTVSFAHPFQLSGADRPSPAGLYAVETDEDDIDGVFFAARRRATTIIYLPGPNRGTMQALRVDPAELAAALAADARPRTAESTDVPVPTEAPGIPVSDARADGPPVATPAPGPWITPVWVVPLLTVLAIALAAWFGPFATPGRSPSAVPTSGGPASGDIAPNSPRPPVPQR